MMKYPEQSEKLQAIKVSFDYLTVAEMAKALGFSQSTMSGYLNGSVCSVELTFSLFETHKISPNWFLLNRGAQFLEIDESAQLDPGIIKSEVLGWPEAERTQLAVDLLNANLLAA